MFKKINFYIKNLNKVKDLNLTFKNIEKILKKKISYRTFISYEKEENYNPDINTKNWDLHKNRLIKFGRSQYKGLTFLLVHRSESIIFLKKVIKFIAKIRN